MNTGKIFSNMQSVRCREILMFLVKICGRTGKLGNRFHRTSGFPLWQALNGLDFLYKESLMVPELLDIAGNYKINFSQTQWRNAVFDNKITWGWSRPQQGIIIEFCVKFRTTVKHRNLSTEQQTGNINVTIKLLGFYAQPYSQIACAHQPKFSFL